MSADRLAWHLDNWAAWMGGRAVRLWYPSRASGRMGSSGSTDFDAMVATADARCAACVDALIDDLPQPQHLAIYHRHLASVWRFPRFDLEQCYRTARDSIAKGLTLRGIW